MSKERLINTRFWNDAWVRKINPLDRYLLLYLLTNEYTNIAGIYELPLETIAYATGIDQRDLKNTMFPKLTPKVYYKNEYVILINFPKYQRLKSDSVKIGIKRELEDVPEKVLEFAVLKGYGDGLDITPPSSHILNLTKLNSTKLNQTDEDSNLIPEVIKLFETINPTCKTYYGNTTQRGAVDFLLDTHGFERVEKVVKELLPVTNGMEFMPTITTPVQLRDKWSALEAAVKRQKIKSKKTVVW